MYFALFWTPCSCHSSFGRQPAPRICPATVFLQKDAAHSTQSLFLQVVKCVEGTASASCSRHVAYSPTCPIYRCYAFEVHCSCRSSPCRQSTRQVSYATPPPDVCEQYARNPSSFQRSFSAQTSGIQSFRVAIC